MIPLQQHSYDARDHNWEIDLEECTLGHIHYECSYCGEEFIDDDSHDVFNKDWFPNTECVVEGEYGH